MTDLSNYTGKPDSLETYDSIARGARDACLTIFRMELDEVYEKARKESRLDAMVDLNEVRIRVEKRIDALNGENSAINPTALIDEKEAP